MNPNKIKSMISWITPKNVIDVIYSMGLVGYDRRFIEYFSKLAYPLTSLQKKETKFVWLEKCGEISIVKTSPYYFTYFEESHIDI